MTVELRTPDQIAKMRVAGRMAAEVLEMIGDYVVPGVTTEEHDEIDIIWKPGRQRCEKMPNRTSQDADLNAG